MSNDTSASDAPFFILGAARSGTTLLRLMLNRHPRLAIPPESHFLTTLFDELPIGQPLAPDQARRAAEIIVGHPRFRTWQVDAASLRVAFDQLAPCFLYQLVDRAFRLEVATSGKPRWGDKTPRYCVCWRQIARLFPDARLIHLVRDGRDVSASLSRVGWHGKTEYRRAKYWRGHVAIAYRSFRELGPQRCQIVRYEDLVLKTETVLGKICDFIGEDYHPTMATFYQDAFDHVADFDGPVPDVHGKLIRPPRRCDVERWRREVSRGRVLLFESIAGRALDAASYPRSFDRGSRWLLPLVGIPYAGAASILELIYHRSRTG